MRVESLRGRSGALGLLLLCAILTALCSLHVFFAQAGRGSSIHARGLDDAYISFRYAENLVRGHGLVYNPGERVEGYSNLLFVLGTAALLPFVERDGLYIAVSLVNILFAVASLFVLNRLASARLGPEGGLVATLLVATSPSLWEWSASGMESLAVLLVQLMLWRLLEESGDEASLLRLALVSSLAILLRADGFVLIAMTVAWFFLARNPRRASEAALVALPALTVLLTWRYVYYERWLPNTYDAKVAGPLVERVGSALRQLSTLALERSLWPWLVAVLIGLAVAARERGETRNAGPFLAVCFVLYFLFIGGDPFGERFLLFVIPVGAFLLARYTVRLRSSWLRFALVAAVVILQTGSILVWPRFQYGRPTYDGWIAMGQHLRGHYPESSLAVDAAGKIPFFSGLPTIDMRGLTDRHIASVAVTNFGRAGHDKMDPSYVLGREPDLIVSWISPNLDVAVGLSKQRYEAAGYRIVSLGNTTTHARAENVISADGLSHQALRRLVRSGYRLAILSRRARLADSRPARRARPARSPGR